MRVTLHRVLHKPISWVWAGLLAACWSTAGPGLGPYSQCDEPAQCAARDFSICLQRELAEDELEALFCSIECPPDGPRACPLGDVYEGVTPMCLPIRDSEKTYCALVAAGDECPPEMAPVDVDSRRLCIFLDD